MIRKMLHLPTRMLVVGQPLIQPEKIDNIQLLISVATPKHIKVVSEHFLAIEHLGSEAL